MSETLTNDMYTTDPLNRVLLPTRGRRDYGPLEQPPAHMRHLTGDELYEALTTDPTLWDSVEFARQCGVKVRTVYTWMTQRNKLDAWLNGEPGAEEFLPTDRTPPRPKHWVNGKSAEWEAGVLRAWMMQVGLMTRDGKWDPEQANRRFQVHGEDAPRPAAPSVVRDTGPALLAEYNELRREKLSKAEAYARLRAAHGLSDTQINKRLEAGRKIVRAQRAGELVGS